MSFGTESPSWGFPAQTDNLRLSEDSQRLQRRKDFKREHGNEARALVASSEFAGKLVGLSRRQKRAFCRAATDFATVELCGLTNYEERCRPANLTVATNQQRFEYTGFSTDYVDSYIKLAQAASQKIVAAFKQ